MVKRSRLIVALALGCVVCAPWSTPSAERSAGTAPIDIVLSPTSHPHLPADLSQLWMAPEVVRLTLVGTYGQFAEAVKLEVDGKFSKALPILVRITPTLGPLRGYGEYYTGLAQLRLGHPAEARDIFHGLADLAPDGYLAEAVALREAECDEALGDAAGAIALYEQLAAIRTTAPEDVLMRLARQAEAAGDREKAAAAFTRLYFEYPLSDQALAAAAALNTFPGYGPIEAGTSRYKLELGRAEKLFAAKRYADARPAFDNLRRAVQADDRELVDLRLAECDYFLKRPRAARDALRLYLEKASRQGEALYFYAVATRDLGDEAQYLQTIRRVADQFPSQNWAEEALNSLATFYIVRNDDAGADDVFRRMYGSYPQGRFAERAAWKIGWWAYKTGRYAETVSAFESGAANFPRSDYRPAWLYWAGRAHEGLQEPALARARYTLAATDYLNSYYGRLAVKHLDDGAPQRRLVADIQAPSIADGRSAAADDALSSRGLPPNEPVIRALLGLKLYDQAADELTYAQKVWGDSAAIQATTAWIYRQQSLTETGARQFALVRGSITTMRRAYPQFLAAGGEGLPKELLRIIYPIAYWDLIQKHAAERNLDPYFVAALIAQESTFVPDIRSSAAAVGLMQLLPATAKQYARRLKIPYSAKTLTTPETNIRIGTAYLADRIREFGQLHLVLASYNAGAGTVRRWVIERSSFALELDEFVDDIPFPETQNYVKKILGTAEDYRRLYGPSAG